MTQKEFNSITFDTRIHVLGSSQIDQLFYSKKTSKLLVRFHKGGEYLYHDVPETVYNQLVDCDGSIGKLFSQTIKGVYEYEKIS